jgi:hypothetical protein
MRDIDNDIRNSLERLTDAGAGIADADALWGDLVDRRRKRRARNGALAALPLLLVAALAVGALLANNSDAARTDVAASGDDQPEAPNDFAPFEMTYRTLTYQGGEMVPSTWSLRYASWTDWETTLIDAGPGIGERSGFRRALSGGTLTEYNPDGTVRLEERVDGRLAPLASMSKGPRTGKAEGGDNETTYRHEYTSTQQHQCPDDPADGAPYCDQAGGTVVVETVEAFNEDGVPVFAEERIADSGRVVWQFETLTYKRLSTGGDADPGNLRVSTIQVVGNGSLDGGTERAVIEFNEPLPEGEAAYVDDIDAATPGAGMVWTTQGPNGTRLCDSRHSVPEGAVGSVDLLIPANWFADGEDAYTGPGLETVDDPAKFPICGPHNGFIQYAMWSPLTADPAEVFVSVSPDRTRIAIEVMPNGPSGPDVSHGSGLVGKFIALMKTGEIEAAATLWSGYPASAPDRPVSERVQYVEQLGEYPPFARVVAAETTTTFVTPSLDGHNRQVVTVLAPRSDGVPLAAVAFVTGPSGEGDAERMWIQRLPAIDDAANAELSDDGYLEPGEQVTVPGLPVEGSVRGFVNGVEIPVEADQESEKFSIVVPDNASGDIALNFVVATPEEPIVRSYAATIR